MCHLKQDDCDDWGNYFATDRSTQILKNWWNNAWHTYYTAALLGSQMHTHADTQLVSKEMLQPPSISHWLLAVSNESSP
jgi:hypothetical protein